MKTLPILLPLLLLSTASLRADSPTPSGAKTQAPSAPAGKIAVDLFWVADARKMDEFLATVPLAQWGPGAPTREVLPETTTAWRDYAAQAWTLARQGREQEAAGRLAQMLKLAEVYRAHGGLQNMVQAEEIRHLAGKTAEALGRSVAAKIQSPYLEKNHADCLAINESLAASEKGEVTASFWKHLQERTALTYTRLSGTTKVEIAAAR